MEIIRTVKALREYRNKVSGSIGFVPTMGALHNGHRSLIEKAREDNDYLIVSIFVNPTQFLEGEDFEKYPRKDEADIKICELCKVDALFMPDIKEIYKDDEVYLKAPKIKGYILEGYKRAGHFDGVLNIVLKLFNLTKPTKAYFGKKDAQQLLLIRQMVDDLFLDIEIIEGDTVREDSGLALSSRNAYLSNEDKERATLLSKALKQAIRKIIAKEKNTIILRDTMIKTINKQIEIEYIEFIDRKFNVLSEVQKGETIILIAGKVAGIRLIDNMWI